MPAKGRLMRSEQQVNQAIEQYADTVLRLCMVYLKNADDTEDVFQTVFLKYTLHDKAFESAEHERAWLIRVTINACKDLLKSVFRSRTVSLEDFAECLQELEPRQHGLLEAVRSLPRSYREVIYLHFCEGYSVPEIAKLLKRNPNTIYTHLRRAKELLRETMGGGLNE